MLRVFGGILIGAALTVFAMERMDRAFRLRPEDFQRPKDTLPPRDGETLAAYTMRREAVIGSATDVWSDAAMDWIPEVNKEKPLDGESLDSFRARSPSNWVVGRFGQIDTPSSARREEIREHAREPLEPSRSRSPPSPRPTGGANLSRHDVKRRVGGTACGNRVKGAA